jgi:hypothetical protein
MRRLPLPDTSQSLVWLDGEAFCVTEVFREEIAGRLPNWLRFRAAMQSSLEASPVSLGEGRVGTLVRRSVTSLGRWLLSWWRKAPVPEVQQAALLFRLQRHGIRSPQLLAFGHRRVRPWTEHSFLLTEAPRGEGTLLDYLARSSSPVWRGQWLRKAGELVRRLHEAGYALGNQAGAFAALCTVQNDGLALTRVDGLQRSKRRWPELAVVDLPKLPRLEGQRGTETMRFFLGYLGTRRLTQQGRILARRLRVRPVKEAAT